MGHCSYPLALQYHIIATAVLGISSCPTHLDSVLNDAYQYYWQDNYSSDRKPNCQKNNNCLVNLISDWVINHINLM